MEAELFKKGPTTVEAIILETAQLQAYVSCDQTLTAKRQYSCASTPAHAGLAVQKLGPLPVRR